ncbi:MAG TPA: hypothetical protein VMV08_01700, partial [Gaiellaceae bacterium]|nr:hypothetical protein [Gaiellaceae bacterium]
VAGRREMSALGRHVEEYLALRRSFGFKLEREAELLAQFVAYTETAGEEHLTSELPIAWAKLPVAASPNQWAKRLGAVRRFAVYLATIDPATEVPPSGIVPTNRRRPAPYLFSARDVERVLEGARGLASPLRAATHEALFGLLAASGMRIGSCAEPRLLCRDRGYAERVAGRGYRPSSWPRGRSARSA